MLLFGETTDATPKSLPLLRIRPSRGAMFILQSAEPVWFSTHFFDRQYLCGGLRCPACEGHASRTRGYIAGTQIFDDRIRPFLLEISQTAWSRAEVSARFAEHSLKPGAQIKATRSKARSPISLDTTGETGTLRPGVADPLYVVSCIATLHGIRQPFEDESLEDWSKGTEAARCQLVGKKID